jgi:hypothetical protein
VGTHRSVSQCDGDVFRSHFFSGAVTLSNAIDDFAKGYHIRGLSTGSIRVEYMDWRGKRTCHVYHVFSYMVYMNLNHRDSRI